MAYSAPSTLQGALSALAAGPVAVIAGGTDFYPGLRDAPAPTDLLDITGIAELRGIARTPTGWRIGACTRWSEIVRADLPPAFDGLKAAGREVGSVQIQNAATVAGNLCNASPAADGVPPLLTLEAEVELASDRGKRRLPLGEFISGVRQVALRPGELVAALHLPDPPAGARAGFAKLGSRRYMVISIAMVAVLVRLDGAGAIAEARIAVGACSPVARRLPALEVMLAGCPAARLAGFDIAPAHLEPLAPIDDLRGTAAYRLDAVAELCRRALAEAVGVAERGDG
ncbi:xanthine dehydrogenase [Maritimibacter sp. 55A14]|uniref:FAD binding domain-containing protein n=1 Tax=Maritimibacter sp. 55A14 TaxID=2174844 RepID=UPI000D60D630|nr:FAD binding domain-containing protein [Maritimibacter sp. 55A14]PWE30501.1 xanthine dehydrogenase [Maritimibacter sp. 55A14]